MREHKDLVDGYAFKFDAAAYDDLVRFVSNERLCCPFITFGVEVLADAGPLWLSMRGPAGTREFLDAELSLSKR